MSNRSAVGIFCAVATWVSTLPALAAEPGILNYPQGGPGALQNDLPPIPGLFAISKTSYASADGLYDDKGKKLDVPGFKLSLRSEALNILGKYPVQLFGAHLYSQLIVPVLSVRQTTTLPFATTRESKDGFGSLSITPAILLWDLPNHQKVQVAFEAATDVGSYDRSRARLGRLNVSTGYASFMPVIGWRYDKPDGLVASVLARAIFNTRNTTTDYQSGTVLVTDFNLGWNVDTWQVGVVGSDLRQVENDSMGPRSPWSLQGRYTNFVAGPSIAYNFGAGIVNLNYQHAWHTANGANNSTAWLNVAFPLYAPPQGGLHTLSDGIR